MARKILILDDDKDILEMLSFILAEEGYEVKSQAHGHDVMPILKEFCPDLVLVDLMLAGIDGRSIVKMIKENSCTESIPVIMMTGRPDLKPPAHEKSGPDGFLAKPFELSSLMNKVHKYV